MDSETLKIWKRMQEKKLPTVSKPRDSDSKNTLYIFSNHTLNSMKYLYKRYIYIQIYMANKGITLCMKVFLLMYMIEETKEIVDS